MKKSFDKMTQNAFEDQRDDEFITVSADEIIASIRGIGAELIRPVNLLARRNMKADKQGGLV